MEEATLQGKITLQLYCYFDVSPFNFCAYYFRHGQSVVSFRLVMYLGCDQKKREKKKEREEEGQNKKESSNGCIATNPEQVG